MEPEDQMSIPKAALGAAMSLLAAALSGAAAEASTITETVDFTAKGSGGPADPVTGSFTITYDPALHYWNETGPDITLNALNIALDSPLAFSYDPGSYLQVGGLAGSAIGYSWGSNDFVLSLYQPNPAWNLLAYSQVGESSGFYSTDVSATFTPVVPVAPTPIPASVGLLGTALLGLVGFGLARRRWMQGAAEAAL
jgi:hypothetical protein